MTDKLRKLHLGCFDQIFAGWVNTDISPHIFIAMIPGLSYLLLKCGILSQKRYKQHQQGIFRSISYMDVTKKFPYRDEKFDCVFCSHLLEHMYQKKAVVLVKEVYRVLKKGGILRISVPDLDKVVASYDSNHPEKFLDGIFEAKQKGDKNKHHWHYNMTSLAKLLNETGFSEIYRCEFRQGRCPDVDLIDNRPESLFMEAIK